MSRLSIDEYLMQLAVAAAARGTCDRRLVGCVIAIDGEPVATGYNGALSGAPHCDDAGHYMVGGHCIRAVHAEVNAISRAPKRGIPLIGGTAYSTTFPCVNCFKLLAASGIIRIVYLDDYVDPSHPNDAMMDTFNFAAEVGMPLDKYAGSRPWED